ncbi:MAG: hypothetical protein C3F11_18120 [Methylocystaceae bacterium]|nr:MAG: hypothetical protein C3F11_18120 [Methylocystaceae bacterium]
MSKLAKLSILGATSAFVCLSGGDAALAGPVGLAEASSVALPAATESVHYRGRSAYHGRSAFYCPPGRRHVSRVVVERRTAYAPRTRYIIERRTAYVPRDRYIIERRTAYVAPTTTIVRAAAPVVAVEYPSYAGNPYGYGYGGGGLIGAGAGLLGGILDVGFGGGGWGGPGWGPGYGGWGWRRRWW